MPVAGGGGRKKSALLPGGEKKGGKSPADEGRQVVGREKGRSDVEEKKKEGGLSTSELLRFGVTERKAPALREKRGE